jgi:MFS family permease
VGALTALLTTGRLSHHLGRRPVVMIALLIQATGMFAFILASSVAWLYVGRVLQGVGTGVATGAVSAWLVDLQPLDNPRRGSIVTGVALLAGLGAGALGAGLLVEYAPNPLELVFWLLIGVYVIGLALMPFLPDVAQRGPGWLRSMRPQVGVPSVARTPFAASVPSLIAIWALAGLYLSLGPALFATLAGSENHAVGVLIIGTLMGFGAVTSVLVTEFQPRLLVIRGSLIVVLGVGLSLIAIVAESSAGLLVGSAVARTWPWSGILGRGAESRADCPAGEERSDVRGALHRHLRFNQRSGDHCRNRGKPLRPENDDLLFWPGGDRPRLDYYAGGLAANAAAQMKSRRLTSCNFLVFLRMTIL